MIASTKLDFWISYATKNVDFLVVQESTGRINLHISIDKLYIILFQFMVCLVCQESPEVFPS